MCLRSSGLDGPRDDKEGEFKQGKSRYEAYYEGQGQGGSDGAIETTAVEDDRLKTLLRFPRIFAPGHCGGDAAQQLVHTAQGRARVQKFPACRRILRDKLRVSDSDAGWRHDLK